MAERVEQAFSLSAGFPARVEMGMSELGFVEWMGFFWMGNAVDIKG